MGGRPGTAAAAFDDHIAYPDQTRMRAPTDRQVPDVSLRDLASNHKRC
ncbi:hypothetical protein Nans01_14330 [Nocardiopsis ansamitocini]|uniref:Uncharacterized protein n=1 Tax=Nocardiopsis ansamitocini TaxID=1670832 RepID=A0A9W6P4R6_9ACTN|nr:hypothetical protein Nans01_14330 [Nocardiopsis ansamitocini]